MHNFYWTNWLEKIDDSFKVEFLEKWKIHLKLNSCSAEIALFQSVHVPIAVYHEPIY